MIESGDGNKQVVTGGTEKERYNVHLNWLKSGRKLPPFIILKEEYPPTNNNSGKNTVAYEIKHSLADNSGNQYPTDNDLYIT